MLLFETLSLYGRLIRLLGQEIYTYTFLYDVSQIELLSLLYLLLFYLFTGGLGPGHEVHPTDTERREHGRLPSVHSHVHIF